jgi:prevent-host-death family protein
MAKWEEVSISEARASLGELVMRVYYTGGTVVLTRNGKAVAEISPLSEASKRRADAEGLKAAVQAIRDLNLSGDMTQEEWEEFVQNEIDDVRKANQVTQTV